MQRNDRIRQRLGGNGKLIYTPVPGEPGGAGSNVPGAPVRPNPLAGC